MTATIILILGLCLSDDSNAAIWDVFDDSDFRFEITSEDPTTVELNDYIGNKDDSLTVPNITEHNGKEYRSLPSADMHSTIKIQSPT